MSKTLHEIEAAIATLPLPERLRLYKDMPQLIGRSAEDLDWQRLGLENFFQDDSPDDLTYGGYHRPSIKTPGNPSKER